MASFENKVSAIFDENPNLAKNIPTIISKIYHESEKQFAKRIENEGKESEGGTLLRLFDIAFIDFYYEEIGSCFMLWVVNNYAERFDKNEILELESQAHSHLDFYEVLDVIPGSGSHVKSLFSGEKIFLKDISSSYKLTKGDIILSRIYPFKGDFLATGALSLFMRVDKDFIKKRVDQAFLAFTKDRAEANYADFAKENWELFSNLGRELNENKLNRKIYSSYGEFKPCEVRFQIKNIQSFLKKLQELEEFNFIGTKKIKKKKRSFLRYEFDWLTCGLEDKLEKIKTGEVDDGFFLRSSQLDIEGNEIGFEAIGDLTVDKFNCRFNTQSLELADFVSKYYPDIFANTAVFKRVRIIPLDKNDRAVPDDPSDTGAPPEIEPDIIKKTLENYYLGLLDQKIPALNNLTPREARNNPGTLGLLREWLKDLENSTLRDKQMGKIAADISLLKQELDIDY